MAVILRAPAVTPEHVARLYGVTVRVVRGWIKTGRLPAVRSGKGWLIEPADAVKAAMLAPPRRYQPGIDDYSGPDSACVVDGSPCGLCGDG